MAIFFNKVQRAMPGNTTVKKWYASLKRIKLVKEKEIARLIADETTLNPKEAEMSLAQLEKVLIRELLAGHSVQLGDWGSFYLTGNSSAHDAPGQVTANSIRKLNVRFTAGKSLKEALGHAEFISTESMLGKSGGNSGGKLE